MGKQKIIRMHSDGPDGTGLEFWGHLESEKVLEGEPVEKGYNYFTNATGQLTAGVWEEMLGAVCQGYPELVQCLGHGGPILYGNGRP